MKTRSKNILAGVIVVLLSFLLMNEGLQTCDDFGYSLHCGTKEPIQGLLHILDSQVVHYHEINGRFLVHCIVQFFAAYSKNLPYVWGMNSLIFLALLVGIHKVACVGSRKPFYVLAPIYVIAIVLFMPALGLTYLGNIACSVNYLWTSCAIVWFIYVYENYTGRNYSNVQKIVLFFFSVVIGSMQESFSIGLAGALCLNWLLNRKSVSSPQFWMMVGFCIGTTILCLAPGNFARVVAQPDFDLFDRVGRILLIFRRIAILPAMVCFLVLCYVKNKGKAKAFIRKHIVILVMILMNFVFCVVFFAGPQQLTSIALCCLLLLFRLLYNMPGRMQTLARVVSVCMIIAFLIPAYYYRKQLKTAHDEMVNARYDYLMSATYDRLMYSDTAMLMRYVTHRYPQESFELNVFSKWAGITPELTLRLPQTKSYIVENCIENYKYSEGVYHNPSDVFWIVRMPVDEWLSDRKLHIITLAPQNFIYRLLGKKRIRVESTKQVADLSCFDNDGFSYVIVMSDAHAPVEEIILK